MMIPPCTAASRRPPLAARLALAVPLAAALAAAAQPGPQSLATTRLNAGIHNIEAEVAQTPEERATGLMFRREMGASHGMLFAFEPPAQRRCFWMKNTLLPLSIAFLADDGTVVNVADMQPQTTESHCSLEAVRYALEMNQGWFAKRGIGRGSRLTGAPFGPP
jgi:uncharacterized membrane protein (UPF0127 family)